MTEKFVPSVLYAMATAELDGKIKEELNIPDPELESAESAIKENLNEN